MIDSFYIGAYWGSRTETLVEVAHKALKTLQKLGAIDEQFLDWYELGMSRKQALAKRVILDLEIIEELFRKAVKKGELGEKGFAEIGFVLGLWTGHKDDEPSNISFNVGAAHKRLSNCCVLKIPYEGTARERLLQPEKAKAIIAMLVETWDPDYAVLTSHGLNDMLNDANEVGWIIYRKSIKRMPKISNKIIYEQRRDGHLFYLVNENYYDDYSLANELIPLKEIIIK